MCKITTKSAEISHISKKTVEKNKNGYLTIKILFVNSQFKVESREMKVERRELKRLM